MKKIFITIFIISLLSIVTFSLINKFGRKYYEAKVNCLKEHFETLNRTEIIIASEDEMPPPPTKALASKKPNPFKPPIDAIVDSTQIKFETELNEKILQATKNLQNVLVAGGIVLADTSKEKKILLAMIEEKIGILYSALSNDDNYKSSIGSEEQFREKLKNQEKATILFNALSNDENYKNNIGTQDIFFEKIGLKNKLEWTKEDFKIVSSLMRENIEKQFDTIYTYNQMVGKKSFILAKDIYDIPIEKVDKFLKKYPTAIEVSVNRPIQKYSLNCFSDYYDIIGMKEATIGKIIRTSFLVLLVSVIYFIGSFLLTLTFVKEIAQTLFSIKTGFFLVFVGLIMYLTLAKLYPYKETQAEILGFFILAKNTYISIMILLMIIGGGIAIFKFKK